MSLLSRDGCGWKFITEKFKTASGGDRHHPGCFELCAVHARHNIFEINFPFPPFSFQMACTQWDKLSPNEFQQLQDLASCKFLCRLRLPDQIYILEFHSRLLTQTRARSLKMFSRSSAGRRRQRLTNLIKMMWVFSRVQFKLSMKNIFSRFHLRSPASGYWLRGLPEISRLVLGLRDSKRALEAPLFIFFTTLSIPGYR